jgi:hypothetical protein
MEGSICRRRSALPVGFTVRHSTPQITLKALSFFADGNLSALPRAVQDRLARAAREVDL